MTRQQDIQKDQWAYLLLGLAVLLGAAIRFYAVWRAGFPINDGGMFYAMIEDLSQNAWRLPGFSSYNQLSIPFVYPPLGFYLVGGLAKLGGFSTLAGVQWIPALLSALTIGVMYFLGQAIFESRLHGATAALAFAFLPRGFGWVILGGGVSRAPGILFLLLTVLNAYHLFFREKAQRIWAVIGFGSLVIMSHPDAALHTVAICILLWAFAPHKRKNLVRGSLAGLGILVLTSPWWLTVINRHGLGPFRSAAQVAGNALQGIMGLFFSNFTEELFFPVIALLALLGMLVLIYRKEWLLPCWLVLPFIVFPRSAATYASIPVALLASTALNDFLIPALAAVRSARAAPGETSNDAWQANVLPVAKVLMAIVLIYGLASSIFFATRLAQFYTVSETQRTALAWIRGAMAGDSRFLVFSGEPNWSQDALKEWFPVLAQRQSVNTLQGKEWLLGAKFKPLAERIAHLETGCLFSKDIACLDQWIEETSLDFDYIYLGLQNPENFPLAQALFNSKAHSLVYRNSEVLIFEVLRAR